MFSGWWTWNYFTEGNWCCHYLCFPAWSVIWLSQMLHLFKWECVQEGAFPLGSAVLTLKRCDFSRVSCSENGISLGSPAQEAMVQDKIGVKLRGACCGVVSKAWGKALIAWMAFSWAFLRWWVRHGRQFVSTVSVWSSMWTGVWKKLQMALRRISVTCVSESTDVFPEQALAWGVSWKCANCRTWSSTQNGLARPV